MASNYRLQNAIMDMCLVEIFRYSKGGHHILVVSVNELSGILLQISTALSWLVPVGKYQKWEIQTFPVHNASVFFYSSMSIIK